MASIHDVAKLAQVSTSTVSKYINKNGYISPEKRVMIQEAIDHYGYSPNRNARMLKTNQSKDVILVVPNIAEQIYEEIVASVTSQLSGSFRVLIQLTDDDPKREMEILGEHLNNACAAILLVTCQPDQGSHFQQLQDKTPLLFLLREPTNMEQYSFIGFNHVDAIYALTSQLFSMGYQDIALFTGNTAFSCEQDCVDGFTAAYAQQGIALPLHHIYSSPSKEASCFRNIMRLLDTSDYPPVVLCSSATMARAISDVAFFRDLIIGRDLFIITLGESSWYNSIFVSNTIVTYRDARKMGSLAASTISDYIQSPMVYEHNHIHLDDTFDFCRLDFFMNRLRQSAPAPRVHSGNKKIRLAFNSADAGASALRSLLPRYKHVSGVEVEWVGLSHHDLYEAICKQGQEKSDTYHLMAVDTPWIPYLQSMGALSDLTELANDAGMPRQFAPNVLEETGMDQGKIWGIPHTYSLQLLYYRKDFFENPYLKDLFFQQYQVPLEPPKTWHMYNIIAKFFSRKHNPNSPCEYGSTLYCGDYSSALCCDLYPRLWAYNGGVFDNHLNVQLYRPENTKAFQSFLESLDYSFPQEAEFMHLGDMQQLIQGEIAMCVSFSNNASFLLDDTTPSATPGSIAFAPIPGNKPVRSGWNIAINPHTNMTQEAWNFIQWFSGIEIASAYTILGGAAPLTSLLNQESLVQMNPWNTLAQKMYPTAVNRQPPSLAGGEIMDTQVIHDILAEVVHRCIGEKTYLPTALLHAHNKLCAYAESCGYPQRHHTL